MAHSVVLAPKWGKVRGRLYKATSGPYIEPTAKLVLGLAKLKVLWYNNG